MVEGATVAPPASRPVTTLGSFGLGARLVDEQRRLNGVALFSAVGLEGSPLMGRSGFAYCRAVPDSDPSAAEAISAELDLALGLEDDAIVPIFETGVSGRVAYVIEDAPVGERLSAWLLRNQRPTPWIVSGLIGDIAAAQQMAHDSGVSHGMVVPTLAWIDHVGKTQLGG